MGMSGFFRAATIMLGLTIAPLVSIDSARATTTIYISVDENGRGLVYTDSTLVKFSGSLKADPGPGGLPSALTYDLGQLPITAGDVVIDGPYYPLTLSDIVRFNAAGTGGASSDASLVFYSIADNGPTTLADTPTLPVKLYSNQFIDQEFARFPVIFYWPNPGQPGYIDFNSLGVDATVIYKFISPQGGVPEPTAWLMLTIGVGLTGSALRFRRRSLLVAVNAPPPGTGAGCATGPCRPPPADRPSPILLRRACGKPPPR